MPEKLDFDAIERFRAKLGMSVSQMAKYLGTSRMSYYRWVEGRSPRPATSSIVGERIIVLLGKHKEGWTLKGKGQATRTQLMSDLMNSISQNTVSGE